MARKIIWSYRAQRERKKILAYWTERNQSNTYSKKLNLLFKRALRLITEHPKIGRQTDEAENIRIKVVKEYLIVYEISEQQIVVLSLWDSRQNPEELIKVLE